MNNKNNYDQQREWSDSHIPYVSRIMIESLDLDPAVWYIVETTPEQDMTEAADLILTDGKEEFMIALRLRDEMYLPRYPFDFTIRREYTDGYKTEYEKMMEGFADMMFYGFRESGKIVRWVFLMVDEFRANHVYDTVSQEWVPVKGIVFERQDNEDGRNCFNGYDINSFPSKEALIIDHSPGYYKDVTIREIPGLKTGSYTLKNKSDRIDR